MQLFLDSCNCDGTRRAYRHSLAKFFNGAGLAEVRAFLQLPAPQLSVILQSHRNAMVQAGAAPASINRRIAPIKGLLRFCHRKGWAQSDGRNLIDTEKAKAFRDTRGLDQVAARRLLKAPSTKRRARSGELGVAAVRDTAIVLLFLSNALRCDEVRQLDVTDFEPGTSRLWIVGKGSRGQKRSVDLAPQCVAALCEYLRLAEHDDGALFRNLDRNPARRGARLTNWGISVILKAYCEEVGVARLTPHQLRHTAITALLQANKGDVAMAQDLSRHADLKTLMIYRDNARQLQGQASKILADLFADAPPKRRRK